MGHTMDTTWKVWCYTEIFISQRMNGRRGGVGDGGCWGGRDASDLGNRIGILRSWIHHMRWKYSLARDRGFSNVICAWIQLSTDHIFDRYNIVEAYDKLCVIGDDDGLRCRAEFDVWLNYVFISIFMSMDHDIPCASDTWWPAKMNLVAIVM